MMKSVFSSFVSVCAAALIPFAARADEGAVGMAKPWQLGFQPPASPVMEKLAWVHDNFLMVIITAITVFVIVLTAYILLRFNRRANPVPSKTTHNTLVEVVWTVLPIFILVAIAIPSLRTHYFMARNPDYEMTLKVTGHQWYWSYEYPDHGGFGFDSYIIKDEDIKPGQHRLLEVDNRVVVPVDTAIRVQMASADVIHSWAVPAFGVKKDAMPGRLNETWFKADKIGVFYGQCSELCGVGHGFMPIAVQVVSKDEFAAWAKQKQKEGGITAPTPEKALPQPKAIPTPAPDAQPTGGVPNQGNTETNPQPDRKADAPAKKAAAEKEADAEEEESAPEDQAEEPEAEEAPAEPE